MKIYLASSWRNERQPAVLEALREDGHEVYDFRNPEEGNTGFDWADINADWLGWTNDQFVIGLSNPIAADAFKLDMDALRWADACVLLLPCGRSAHLELGWAVGAGKFTVVVLEGNNEPELMYRMAGCATTSVDGAREALRVRALHG